MQRYSPDLPIGVDDFRRSYWKAAIAAVEARGIRRCRKLSGRVRGPLWKQAGLLRAENENGLSGLVELPEVPRIFGRDLAFEFTALFCDSFGPNFRNELAHGLPG